MKVHVISTGTVKITRSWQVGRGSSLRLAHTLLDRQFTTWLPINCYVIEHPEGLLPTCSFVLTAKLSRNTTVRGESCDLGGVGGGFGLQSVDGKTMDTNPFGLNMTIDYCLEKVTVDRFFELAPMQ